MSIMKIQMTLPELAFRGRHLKPTLCRCCFEATRKQQPAEGENKRAITQIDEDEGWTVTEREGRDLSKYQTD